MNKYYDRRQGFWKEAFEQALPYARYLEAAEPVHRDRWRAMEARLRIPEPVTRTLGAFRRRMGILCYSGVWCGDCVRQGPLMRKMAALAPEVEVRYAERVEGSPLSDELRINGAAKVPVMVFLSEDFFELGRFGDRLLAFYRHAAAAQLGPACDAGIHPPPEDELQAEIGEWADIFERMQWILRLSPMLRERYGD